MNTAFMVIDASNNEEFGALTQHRVPGALPFLGKYRLIDFSLSNAFNSKITNVAIFPYGNYRSLTDHIGSGDRWNLDRRKDGIFILPPKNYSPVTEKMISFQRMYEHVEYFLRSSQDYVIITSSTVVWNVDFRPIIDYHVESGADITEVVSRSFYRLNTFILSRKKLLDYINEYDTMAARNVIDVFDYMTNIEKNTYAISEYCYFIKTLRDYYRASQSILHKDIRMELFNSEQPIKSKETMSVPAFYGEYAKNVNSLVASGAIIEGEVINSIVSRKVHVKKGAVVKNCVLMNQAIVEENAYIENAILDKSTTVKENAKIIGSEHHLFVTEKKQNVFDSSNTKVVQISVECTPFVKTGGLADVVGSLAVNLSDLGVDSRVILPLYSRVKDRFGLVLKEETTKIISLDNELHQIRYYSYTNKNTIFYFVDLFQYFSRKDVYGYNDDGERFGFFSKCAIEFLNDLDFVPDIIHIHDWHCGLVPLIIKKYPKLVKIRTLHTIHNIEYQGIFSNTILHKLELNDYYDSNATEINFMEIGLNTATKISTVSKTYMEEIKYQYYSSNLQEVILRRERDLYGIVNGLDKKINPTDDITIKMNYGIDTVYDNKPINKAYLQEVCHFKAEHDAFIIGMVTRIVEHKGFDIILRAFDEIMRNPKIHFVLLGTGEEKYLKELSSLEGKYQGRMKVFLTYDGTNPSYIYSGADLFLMPSRIEPCGIGQMIALRYGTIPLVRQTGGLNDTIQAFDLVDLRGNGFKFYNYDYRDLVAQVNLIYNLYETNKQAWHILIKNAMKTNNSLEKCAREYLNLYNTMKNQ